MATIGRNDPCPCGSGKKYKKCCQQDEAPAARPHPAHKVDRGLVLKLMRFANQTRGVDWVQEVLETYASEFDPPEDPEQETGWSIPYLLYHEDGLHGDEPTVLDDFVEARIHRLSRAELAVLKAHRATWASLWEIVSIRPGQGLQVRDLLTGAERFVHELSMAEEAWVRQVFLGRVLDLEDASILIGVHPFPLPPMAADQVRTGFLSSTPQPTREDLRMGRSVLDLSDRWRTALQELRKPPSLSNTDGDPFMWIRDRLPFPATLRPQLLERLATHADVELRPSEEDATTRGIFYRPDSSPPQSSILDKRTILATFDVGPDFLILQTNSEKRADTFRKRLLGLDPSIRKGRRTRKSMQELQKEPHKPRPTPPPEVQAAMQEALRIFRREHMSQWPDHPLPALEGKTPRQAAADSRLRDRLEVLLKQMEYSEARLPPEQRLGIEPLRLDLGLSEVHS